MLAEEYDEIVMQVVSVRRTAIFLRRRRGWSQADAASQLGVLRETLSYIESGKQKLTLEMVLRMARVYECGLSYLLAPRDWDNVGVPI